MNIQLPITIVPQSTRYQFEGVMPMRIGEVVHIIVEGDNAYEPWRGLYLPRVRRVILLEDGSGRQWLVETR